MKNQLKKSLMAVAVGAALVGAGVTAANANSLLFPYYNFDSTGNFTYFSLQTSPGITTLAAGANQGKAPIHFVYFGAPTGGTYTSSSFCAHQQDGIGYMTPNDLVNMLVSSNPTTPTDPTSGNLFGDQSQTFSLTLPAAAGFAVVSNVTGLVGGATNGTTTAAQDLTGEAVVVNANPNVVFGYSALTNASADEGDFSNITAATYNLSWYPSNAMTTQWYALAVGDQYGSVVQPAPWSAVSTATLTNVYNRDEVPLSQNVKAVVGCGTTLTLGAPADATGQQLVSPANLVAITNGGLLPSNFVPTNTTASTGPAPAPQTTGTVVFKVEQPQFLSKANAFFTLMRNTDGTGKLGF